MSFLSLKTSPLLYSISIILLSGSIVDSHRIVLKHTNTRSQNQIFYLILVKDHFNWAHLILNSDPNNFKRHSFLLWLLKCFLTSNNKMNSKLSEKGVRSQIIKNKSVNFGCLHNGELLALEIIIIEGIII